MFERLTVLRLLLIDARDRCETLSAGEATSLLYALKTRKRVACIIYAIYGIHG